VPDRGSALRTTENGRPIDASGELLGIAGAEGTFDGAVELVNLLARSERIRECAATQWFRFAVGRHEAPADDCVLGEVRARFAEGKHRIRDLVLAVATSPAFMFRQAPVRGQEGCTP